MKLTAAAAASALLACGAGNGSGSGAGGDGGSVGVTTSATSGTTGAANATATSAANTTAASGATASSSGTSSSGTTGATTSSSGSGTAGTTTSSSSATSASSTSSSASSSSSGGVKPVLRIMPLGDSTTGSVCWRADLWKMLNTAGHTGKFQFVGSRNNDGSTGAASCDSLVPGYDQHNEGHPSVLVTDFVNDADNLVSGVQTPQALLGQNPADVVLFHFATNDVWNGKSTEAIEAAYTTVLQALRQANPKVVVLVAQLIPMAVTAQTCSGCSCANCVTDIPKLNSALAGASGWAAKNSTASSPIVVVDQYTGFDATMGADTQDGVHPNASGSTKIATKWAAALASYF